MQKWEYKLVRLEWHRWVDDETRESLGKYEERVKMLNALGEVGWELTTEVNSFALCTLTFKRARMAA